MNGVEEITATKREARAKYKEYRAALAVQPYPWVRELKDAYNQLRRGHGIIDVFKAFKKAGVNADGEPRLAIYPANETLCHFEKRGQTAGHFMLVPPAVRWDKSIIELPAATFPEWKTEGVNWGTADKPVWRRRLIREKISCPVPIIPPALLPRADLSNFHILWEVEKWNLDAPYDPLLLRRVSNNLFAVVARWDLTELERAVIAGRIR